MSTSCSPIDRASPVRNRLQSIDPLHRPPSTDTLSTTSSVGENQVTCCSKTATIAGKCLDLLSKCCPPVDSSYMRSFPPFGHHYL
jgi:hypothetical protein